MYLSDIVPRLSKSKILNEWRILAVCDENGRCDAVLNQIAELSVSEQRGISKLLQRAAAKGPKNGLPSECRHEICKKRKIYEFKKGNFRLAYFYDDSNLVICSHIFRKRGQTKGVKKEADIAARLKEEYFKEKELGTIRFIEASGESDGAGN